MVSMDRKGDVSYESFFGLYFCDEIRKLLRIRIRMRIRVSVIKIIKRIKKSKNKGR